MTHRTLIIARIDPASTADIAEIFADSDRGPLPGLIGVTGRSLFQFEDIYLHLVEAESPPEPEVFRHRNDPDFRDISKRLAQHVRPYDPATWHSPLDAMANEFYRWERSG